MTAELVLQHTYATMRQSDEFFVSSAGSFILDDQTFSAKDCDTSVDVIAGLYKTKKTLLNGVIYSIQRERCSGGLTWEWSISRKDASGKVTECLAYCQQEYDAAYGTKCKTGRYNYDFVSDGYVFRIAGSSRQMPPKQLT